MKRFKVKYWVQNFAIGPMDLKPTEAARAAFVFTA
jgi:hypothetical protein